MRYYCRPTTTGGLRFMRTLGVGRAERLSRDGQWVRDDFLWSEEHDKGNWHLVTPEQMVILNAELEATSSVA